MLPSICFLEEGWIKSDGFTFRIMIIAKVR
jgi:hypothetical protein